MRKLPSRTCRHKSGTDCRGGMAKTATNRGKISLSCGDVQRCAVTPELQHKRWRIQSSRGCGLSIVCTTPTTSPSISRLWDVFQSVRTLFSNRHINVSDLKIRNLEQTTSGRPVTVPSTFPHFQKLLSVLLESFANIRIRWFAV